MPHRRNLYKLTGDTHLPDVGDDFYWNDIDVDAAEDEAPASPTQAIAQQAKREVGMHPLLAAGLALAAGYLLMKMVRR
ncbi:hypothetical protein LZ009_14850 [Ramlibacter sp. XY19]|uniref:hypothetical protein n=1 Tax=Ramlibacter paludis TaxID=2908000 RepID=UPI0023DB4F84|nr:hypothetical protein [Ramlibacter paludis]MCG2594057.1 hypothetical protein [Ramlibacter paludis]